MIEKKILLSIVLMLGIGFSFSKALYGSDEKDKYQQMIELDKAKYQKYLEEMQSEWNERMRILWGQVKPSTTLQEREYKQEAYSEIDFSTGMISVTGVGIDPDEYIAEKMALYHGLAEMKKTLLKIKVDGYLTLKDVLQLKGPALEEKLDSFIEEHIEFEENDNPKKTVDGNFVVKKTIWIPFHKAAHHERAERGTLKEQKGSRSLVEFSEELVRPKKMQGEKPEVRELRPEKKSVSSLIVDAAGTNYFPRIHPKIISETGRVLYEKSKVELGALLENGSVSWAASLEDAQADRKAGKTPVVVKSLRVGENGEIILTSTDFDRITRLEKQNHFLRQGNLVVILDN